MNPFGLIVIAIGGLLVWIAIGGSASPSFGDPVQAPGSTGGVPNTVPGSKGSKKLISDPQVRKG